MRLSLASTLRNRTHQTTKDARLLNAFVEKKNDLLRIVKRPALLPGFSALEAGAGEGQGLFVLTTPGAPGVTGTSTLIGIQNDVLNNSPTPVVYRLSFTTQPADWKIATAISPSVVVTAQNVLGQTMTSYTGTVTISLASNPSGGTLSGTLSVAAVAGVATFSNLKLDKVGGGYKLKASSGLLRSATSSSFKIVSSLSFTVQPFDNQPNVTFDTPVEVSVVDSSSAVISGYSGDITLRIGTNPAGGTLSGTLTVSAVAGVASFSNLQINQIGDGYTLVASSSSGNLVEVTSGTFDIAQYTLVISSDTSDYNVRTAFQTKYGTPPSTVYTLLVKVNSGKVVSATTTATPGMTWGASWPGTPTFKLKNLGYIIGKGGAGAGDGGNPGATGPGLPGGKAIELSGKTINITNAAGFIWGGGGGGGEGGFPAAGIGTGGGGGGAGNGAGGLCTNYPPQAGWTQFVTGTNGASALGSLITQTGVVGGVGEAGYFSGSDFYPTSGDGGFGGDYGMAGIQGTIGHYHLNANPEVYDEPGGAGGAAGKAINLSGGVANFVSGSSSPNVKGVVS
jgi:hypothetical protein